MGLSIPDRIGLAGVNPFEVLGGLPLRIATMDSQRNVIGRRAAELVAANALSDAVVTLAPVFLPGDTVR